MLTRPDKRGGRWELDEFFATGDEEVEGVLAGTAALGLPARRERALDFGCGAGRLTRALAARFAEAVGVDVAASMVETARRLNADRPNATFVVNAEPHLRRFGAGEFDFAYSSLVLQHLPTRELAARYLGELVRVLRPDGLLVFQLPAALPLLYRLQPSRRLFALLRRLGVSEERLLRSTPLTPMRMLAVPERSVREVVEAGGGRVLRVEPVDPAGRNLRYFVASSSR